METKIQLSEEEWNLVMNAGILLTKNRAMEKIALFLGELANISSRIFSAESLALPEADNGVFPAHGIYCLAGFLGEFALGCFYLYL